MVVVLSFLLDATGGLADSALFWSGGIALILFYAITEVLKQITYKSVLKGDKSDFFGLIFGSGFILAQNLLVLICILLIGIRMLPNAYKKG